MGLSRTFQTSRLFGGLTVEDNLYLAVLGVARRPPPARPSNADDARCASKARAMAEAVGLDRAARRAGRPSSPTASSASSRSAWRARASPKLMMLDEPAAGLSRAERVRLTELLLALDPAITLILIEHDMDVALRVAEWVTMMHDGRVIVEGTPDRDPRQRDRARPLPRERAHRMS